MTRQEGYELLQSMIKNKNLIRHALAVEAIMRSLCSELKVMNQELRGDNFNEEEWGLVGLLHDADYEVTDKDLNKHTLVITEKLKEKGLSDYIVNGIKAHSGVHKPNRENLLEKTIFASDELSGLITAVTLVRPDKKLSSVTVDSIMKKFPQKSFAAGANREQILTCDSELGIPLEKFVGIGLKAMQSISGELGL